MGGIRLRRRVGEGYIAEEEGARGKRCIRLGSCLTRHHYSISDQDRHTPRLTPEKVLGRLRSRWQILRDRTQGDKGAQRRSMKV